MEYAGYQGELGACTKKVYQAFFSPPPHKSLGNESTLVPYLAVAKAETPELCEFAPTD